MRYCIAPDTPTSRSPSNDEFLHHVVDRRHMIADFVIHS